MSNSRVQVEVPVQPWFQDHCFGGRIILPAVETMHLLGMEVNRKYPELDIRVMEDARFAKFLEIPPESKTVSALIETAIDDHGRIQAKLLSRIKFKAMNRIKEHGAVFFSSDKKSSPDTQHQSDRINPASLTGTVTEVRTKHLYEELVPFGPAYHTLQDTLYLSGQGAWGKLKAPDLPVAGSILNIMGSPFPLDGALHAACVLGQQSVGFVPFPVGFDLRVIARPTRPGGQYITRVVQVSQSKNELVFYLGIFDIDGEVCETVTGVRMRDVGKAKL